MNDNNLTAYNEFRAKELKGPPYARTISPKMPRGLRMTNEGWEGLRVLATTLGYPSYQGGNITAFLEALGAGLWLLEVRMQDLTTSIEEDE